MMSVLNRICNALLATEIIDEETKLVDQIINFMILLWFFLSAFALWFSLQRSELVGYGFRKYVHIGSFLLIIVVGLLRNYITPHKKAFLFILFQLMLAVIGVLSFGLLAPAILFLPLICVILALFYNHNVVVVFATLTLLFVALAGYGFQTGLLTLKVDANDLFVSTEHWFLYVVSFTILVQFVSMAIIKYRVRVHQLFLEIKAQKNAIKHLANHDFLTGMPLVQLMIEQFESISSNLSVDEHNMALVFLDLDDLKHINDGFGHDAGDICLIHTANAISKTIGFRDFACRLGGDEFLLLIPQLTDDRKVNDKVNGILKAIEKPFMFNGQQLTIGVSAGVAFYKQHGHKFSDLKRAADLAMYEAKQNTSISISVAE